VKDKLKSSKADKVKFAHPSEKVCAEILDYYGIDWEYEPTTFPISWDEEGNITESFTPDFYLPEFDLYIELTTMNQRLVTRKNRKIRKLKELYPHINIKTFYQKDFKKLLLKYGLQKKSKELIGKEAIKGKNEEKSGESSHKKE
jgi:hypothetical protein